ncbi:MAG: hypothetical protein JSS32_05855 [Verrucomicrobia bacterium]|nr:hypothetical protein [Verrucomicrobiota bacterium]
MTAPVATQPTFSYLTPKEVEKLPSDWSCVTCLEKKRKEALLGHGMHVFHAKCVVPWLNMKKGACPICRIVCNYDVVKDAVQSASWAQSVRSTVEAALRFFLQPGLREVYAGVAATFYALLKNPTFLFFSLGMGIMARGFAITEQEFKANGTLYEEHLNKLIAELDETRRRSDEALLRVHTLRAERKPPLAIEDACGDVTQTAREFKLKQDELNGWKKNVRLRNEYESYKAVQAAKRILTGILFVTILNWISESV